MNSKKRGKPGQYPGARLKHVSDARRGSTPYMVALLADARRFATKFGIDADACWKRAGGVVEAEASHVARELVRALQTLLQAPALNPEAPIDGESDRAIGVALAALELTRE